MKEGSYNEDWLYLPFCVMIKNIQNGMRNKRGERQYESDKKIVFHVKTCFFRKIGIYKGALD